MKRKERESDAADPERGSGDGAARWSGLREAYASTGVVLLNFVVLLFVLNLLLGAGFAVRDALASEDPPPEGAPLFREDGAPVETPKRTEEMMTWFDFGAFEDVSAEAAGEMLDDYYDLEQLGFVYQPWVQFAEPPFDGERVHVDVDSRGFPVRRTTNEEVERGEKVVRIFAMGGSTTFGYWVSDRHTWPSHLSRILNRRAEEQDLPFRIEVINYGRGYFHPTQESVLLGDLLRSGHRPGLVIFLDGVNWGGGNDAPYFSPQAAEAFSDRQHGTEVTEADLAAKLEWIPLVRAVWDLRLWLARLGGDGEPADGGASEAELNRRADLAVRRFRQARQTSRDLCENYGCETLFFLQPDATYGYDLDLFRLELPESFRAALGPSERFYGRMKEESAYIDLTHLFREWGPDRKAVVDYVHYSPGFNRFVAEHVAGRIDLDELPVPEQVVDTAEATGPPRPIVRKGEWLRPESNWSGFER